MIKKAQPHESGVAFSLVGATEVEPPKVDEIVSYFPLFSVFKLKNTQSLTFLCSELNDE
jgi:hypothetical protein